MEEPNSVDQQTSMFNKTYPVLTKEVGEKLLTTAYIYGEIQEPHAFIELIAILDNAEEGDEVTLKVSSGGGFLAGALALCDAIERTKALVVGECIGENASAATILLLSCDDLVVTSWGSFMIHAYSSGYYGKRAEVRSALVFELDQLEHMFNEIYTPFLSEDECKQVLNKSEDIYLNKEQIEERWKLVQELRYNNLQESVALNMEAQKDAEVQQAREILAKYNIE